MTEYLVRNICTECSNPVETTVRNGRHAHLLKGGPCICNKCVPESKWRARALEEKMNDCDIFRTRLCCHYWRKHGKEGCRYRMSHNVKCRISNKTGEKDE